MEERFQKHIPRDEIYLFNTGNARKAWTGFGCRYISELECHRFLVWAPNARAVSVVGDFNDWDPAANPMEWLEGGVWIAFIEGVREGQNYKFRVEKAWGGCVLKADPFAAWSQTRGETASRVWCREEYPWTDGEYLKLRDERDYMTSPMSIYEIHPGSWREFEGGPNYHNLADALAEYCTDMGYTHVELMPITEYPYDGSWGYQVTGYFAPTSRYGDPDDFKAFVDRLHAAGIGVIVDWVPAHFPKDEFGLAEFDGTPLFECKERRMAEHPDWGTLIFDYASTQVQSFLISSAFKLLDVFHVDGIRVDAVSSMLYLNYGRREGEYTPNEEGGSTNLHALRFLRKLNSLIHTDFPGVVTIAEESTAFPLVTAPAELGGVGFSLSESFVLAYSHDEVVHGKGSMINKMYGDYDQKFSSLRALYGYQFGHPGKKLTFMGNEFGQFIEWNWRQGLDWMLLGFVRHEQLRRWMRQLNLLYAANPALYAVDRSWDGFKWLNVDDAGRSSVAFLRSAPEEDSYLVCVCNFTPVSYRKFLIGLPGPGTLREVLNSDDEEYGGTGVSNPEPILSEERDFLDMHHCAELTLPPMSCVFFRYIPKT